MEVDVESKKRQRSPSENDTTCNKRQRTDPEQSSSKFPLHEAILTNNVEAVQKLVAGEESDIDVWDEIDRVLNGETVLELTLRMGNPEMVSLIAKEFGSEFDEYSVDNLEDIWKDAFENEDTPAEILRAIAPICYNVITHHFCDAADDGRIEDMKRLLEFGANINGDCDVEVCCACEWLPWCVPILRAAFHDEMDAVKWLIEQGADHKQCEHAWGSNLLMAATMQHCKEFPTEFVTKYIRDFDPMDAWSSEVGTYTMARHLMFFHCPEWTEMYGLIVEEEMGVKLEDCFDDEGESEERTVYTKYMEEKRELVPQIFATACPMFPPEIGNLLVDITFLRFDD